MRERNRPMLVVVAIVAILHVAVLAAIFINNDWMERLIPAFFLLSILGFVIAGLTAGVCRGLHPEPRELDASPPKVWFGVDMQLHCVCKFYCGAALGFNCLG